MRTDEHEKVTAGHLKRNAYLYVRQSTVRQVFENTESTERQYGLRQRAIALGWPAEQVIVIDNDLGRSGASSVNRAGFQKLVAEVGMGKAGLVMGLEVSRLARNSADWHRLLEICALTDALILDEDGLYDPKHFNDRLVLGLKGTMSEAELHLLGSRLRGGITSKAQRGELQLPLPVGLVYDAQGRVVLDPDVQVQESLRLFFQTYRRTGSAFATVKSFRRQEVLFPRRLRKGMRKGELLWDELRHTRARQILHNPRYAGAFVFGRTHTRRRVDGRVLMETRPRSEWQVLLPGVHPGYISWEEFEDNQRRLKEAAQSQGKDRRKSPPREGPALLQGLVVCGRCGQRMTVRYDHRSHGSVPEYACQRNSIDRGEPLCQRILGTEIDRVVGDMVVEAVSPVALEVALTVQQELQARLDEADRLRQKQVERARYEAELARCRYMEVDPKNRFVADTLEADWNEKLRAVSEAQEQVERARQSDRAVLDGEQREKILALATDFPRLWQAPQTPHRERKRMIRLLLEDVTLMKKEQITAQIRFKGGPTKTVELPLPRRLWEICRTPPEVVAEVDRLLDHHTDGQIALILNQRGWRSGRGRAFHGPRVACIRGKYGLKSRYDRLREKGMLTLTEMAQRLGVSPRTVRPWYNHGLLTAHVYNDKNECLYEWPGDNHPVRMQGRKLVERRLLPTVMSNRPNEV